MENDDSRKRIGLVVGLVLFLVLLITNPFPGKPTVGRTAAVAVLMAVWWVSEAVPLAVTGLVPLVAFPLLKVLPGKAVAGRYFNSSIALFLGGFLVALAIERWNLHRRIALTVVSYFGSSPRRLVLGFMVATGFLSMWISNTATTMMMLPIGVALILSARESCDDEKRVSDFGVALMLGIAYSASIGGMGTLIGTPPNLAFSRIFVETFPSAPSIAFTQWLIFALPLVCLFLVFAWVMLAYVLFPLEATELLGSRETVRAELSKLGRISRVEIQVLIVFVLAALAWILRSDLNLEGWKFTGWASHLGLEGFVDDGTVAIAAALLLFVLPAAGRQGERVLSWEVTKRLPWGILLLFGGGFALAAGFTASGLSAYLGTVCSSGWSGLPTWVTVLAVTASVCFLTELTSNTATTQMILPILASVSTGGLQMHPLTLMLPATLSASCAFMLPVATPPNAIVFGSGLLRIRDMVRAGIVLNLVGIALVVVTTLVLGPIVFGITGGALPAWAH